MRSPSTVTRERRPGWFHRIVHRLQLQSCEGIVERVPAPVYWRYGVRCVSCGKEKWFA